MCGYSLVVILGCHPALVQSPALLPLARLGDFSYSLYLVHWPLFAFANNAYVIPVPMPVNIGLVVVALALGYALYRYVELPVRRAPIKFSGKSLATMVAASIALVLISLGVTKLFSPATDYRDMRRVNHGFGPTCESETEFRLTAACSNSSAPKILIWGDSFAMHLVPGLVATTELGVAQATKSFCGPLEGLAAISEPTYGRSWAEGCLRFNQSVLKYLTSARSVEYVVLASPFSQYLGDKAGKSSNSNLLRTEGGELIRIEPSESLAIERIRATVSKLRLLGKRVVVVAPPPSSGFDLGRCLELNASGKLFLGADGDSCRISTRAYLQHHAAVRHFLEQLPRAAQVNVVGFDDALCSAQVCETELNGVFIYRDGGHLSIEGSRKLGISMGLVNRLLAAAK